MASGAVGWDNKIIMLKISLTCIEIPSMLLKLCHCCQISCGEQEDTGEKDLMKRSAAAASEYRTYGQTDKRWEQVIMLLQMTYWLVNDVSASRWFANRLPDVARLHVFHDSHVSVIPFNARQHDLTQITQPAFSFPLTRLSFLVLILSLNVFIAQWTVSFTQTFILLDN